MNTTRYGTRRYVLSSLLVALVSLGLLPAPALAVTTNWIDNTGGPFTTAANWDNGVPDADDVAVFDRGSGVAYTVSFALRGGADITNDRLIVGSNTVTFNATGLSASDYYLDSTATTEADAILGLPVRGVTIGAQANDTAAVLISHLSLLQTVAATLGHVAGSNGTLTLDQNNDLFNVTGGSTTNAELIIGRLGTGVLNVSGGADVTVNADAVGFPAGGISLGRGSSGQGTANISGSGSTLVTNTLLAVGDSGTGTLNVTAGGLVESRTGVLGIMTNSAGTATVSGGATWNSFSTLIGYSALATGTLNILSGGVVTSGTATIGQQDGSSGAVTVDGMDSRWTVNGSFKVGDSGHGVLQITNGGRVVVNGVPAETFSVGVNDTAVGEVVVNSARWDNSQNLFIGHRGTGTLTISQGQVTNRTAYLGSNSDDPTKAGSATVSGIGALWNNTDLVVGNVSTGTLRIEAGGVVTSVHGIVGGDDASVGGVTVTGTDGHGNASTWNVGQLEVAFNSRDAQLRIEGGGRVESTHSIIGLSTQSNGTVTVTGTGGAGNPSTWASSENLTVGNANMATGTLLIENGGSVSNSFGLIGDNPGSTGNVTVTGNDSTWDSGMNLIVGNSGTGTLSILEGGRVSNANGLIGGTGTGVVTVSGAAGAGPSTWINHNELLIGAGEMGEGTLRIEAGGSVFDETGSVGFDAMSTGTVTVTGMASTWSHGNFLRVGDSGTGTLTIAAGGSVSNDGNGFIGAAMNSAGTVTVTGAGSTWNSGGDLFVGNSGKGILMIQAGGSVSAATGSIAAAANSTGTATVSGANSNLIISGRLAVGGNAATATNGGTGTLHIQEGAAVTAAQDLVLFPDGLVDFEGGTLSTPAISFQAGGEFEWTGGTLHVDVFNGDLVNQGGTLAPGESPGSTAIVGDYAQQSAGTVQIEIGGTLVNSQYDLVNISGNAILDGNLEIALINGFVPAASDTFTVFSADTILNFFSNVTDGQRLNTTDGLGSFLVHYGPTSTFNPNQIVLTNFALASIPGDYNRDGTVDAADYVVWRKNDGLQAGYDTWRANFGATADGAAAVARSGATGSASASGATAGLPNSAAVPEPATLWLALACLAVLLRHTHSKCAH